MSKKNLEIDSLRTQLALAQNQANRATQDANYYKSLADNYNTELHRLGTKLQQERQTHADAMIAGADALARKAMEAIKEVEHKAQLAIVSAERDALGKALTYTIDNLTQKA